MPIALVKIIARRTKDGFEKLSEEVIGITDQSEDSYLDSLAKIMLPYVERELLMEGGETNGGRSKR